MRPGTVLALVGVATVASAAPAAALAAGGGHPRVSATPRTVHFGQQQTVKGRQWAVIEFCRRTVRLSLVSSQNVADIGTARVRTDGTFTRHWTPRRAAVGAGDWNLRVTQRCESGKDGSTIFVRRAIRIHIR